MTITDAEKFEIMHLEAAEKKRKKEKLINMPHFADEMIAETYYQKHKPNH